MAKTAAENGRKTLRNIIAGEAGFYMEKNRIYMCIDMKSFFASVECAERGLNPFTTNLVVADESRGSGTICLAITPRMKASGVKNRCRVFEIPKSIKYITAKPRMRKYIDYAAEIYGLYLDYMDKSDIYVYSIDESFIDATDYLKIYGKTPREYARFLIGEIARRVGIPATAGVGTNLYLAKVALDLTAKHSKDGVGYLDEQIFKDTLWDHRPLSDFWGIANGISARLARKGIYTMRGIANCPEEILYKEFGINAELIIDHAFGRESCTMPDIKNYRARTRSLSNSQVLFSDYEYKKARLVMEEMARSSCLELIRRKSVTNRVGVYVGYSKGAHASTGGSSSLKITTNLSRYIIPAVMALFDRTTVKNVPIRRLGLTFDNLCDEGCEGYDLFTDMAEVERERNISRAVLEIQNKFGKNAIVMAADLEDGATLIERNKLIGGHNAGF